jgi:hypothetical protein
MWCSPGQASKRLLGHGSQPFLQGRRIEAWQPVVEVDLVGCREIEHRVGAELVALPRDELGYEILKTEFQGLSGDLADA